MSVAQTIAGYLQSHQIPYDVIMHPYHESSRAVAESAHVSPECMAKAVILSDRNGYLMAVVPGNRYVSLDELWKQLGRRMMLAPEDRIRPIFQDCESGAIPPLGPAYGMMTVVDHSLVGKPEIYFESGDHRGLIRVRGDAFLKLLHDAEQGLFTH